jgi:hypothetical protein
MRNWRIYNRSLIPSISPEILITDSIDRIKDTIKEENLFFARWVTNFDCIRETGFWYVINDTLLTIDDYSRNTRSKIRRGLNNFSVKEICFNENLEACYEIYCEAFDSYNTLEKCMSILEFKSFILSRIRNKEFLGLYDKNNRLEAFCVIIIYKNSCELSTIKFRPSSLKRYSGYCLYYTLNKRFLSQKRFRFINNGSRSLLHKTNVHNFLIEKFKYRRAFCDLHICYNNYLRIIVIIIFPLRSLLRIFSSRKLEKINAVLFQEEIHRNNNK